MTTPSHSDPHAEREKALAAYARRIGTSPSGHERDALAFGYDAARAECERKVADLRINYHQMADDRANAEARVRELEGELINGSDADAGVAALAAWMSKIHSDCPAKEPKSYRYGWNAARAEYERKVDDERKRVFETERQWANEVGELVRDKEAMQHERDEYYDDWQKAEARVRDFDRRFSDQEIAHQAALATEREQLARARSVLCGLLDGAPMAWDDAEHYRDTHALSTPPDAAPAVEGELWMQRDLLQERDRLRAELEGVKRGRDAWQASSDDHYDQLQQARASLAAAERDLLLTRSALERAREGK